MASNGPPDDFHNQQTRYANYGAGGRPEIGPDQQEAAEPTDPFNQEVEPTPWYRRPVGFIAWVIVVLILIGLIVYGIMDLIQGSEGTSPTPSTSTTPTTTPSTTPPPTTTESPAPPPTSSAVEPPAQQPTEPPTQQPTRAPTQQPPTHRHHLPSIPSVINIPGMPAITLPPGMPYEQIPLPPDQ